MHENLVGGLIRLAVDTMQNPKKGLRVVLDFVITMPHILQAAALVVSIDTLISVVLAMADPNGVPDVYRFIIASPILAYFVQLAGFFLLCGAVYIGGKFFDGHGTFKETVTALLWLHIILVMMQIVITLISFLSFSIAGFVSMGALFMTAYLFVQFIMEVHGFKNVFAVIAGIVAAFFGCAFLVSVLLVMLGFVPETIPNV